MNNAPSDPQRSVEPEGASVPREETESYLDPALVDWCRRIDQSPAGGATLAHACRERPDLAERLRRYAAGVRMVGSAGDGLDPDMPARLGDFQLIECIARGGMGEIFRARQTSLGREVAVKVIRRGRVAPEAAERFAREQRALARLHQTNIVPIYSAGTQGDIPYFAMPYVKGVNLSSVLKKARQDDVSAQRAETPSLLALANETPLDAVAHSNVERDHGVEAGAPAPSNAAATGATLLVHSRESLHSIARSLAEAAEALAHAHAAGIVHRDVKPSNMMLARDGRLFLIDFGLASLEGESTPEQLDATREVTHSSSLEAGSLTGERWLGTPEYMAPEQMRGQTGPANDVFGLGVTLYELLTHQPAFRRGPGEHPVEFLAHRVHEKPRPVSSIVKNAPWELRTICDKAMQTEPTERYASPAGMAADLRLYLRGEPISLCGRFSPRRPVLWALRHRARAVLAASSVAALIGFVVLFARLSEAEVTAARNLAEVQVAAVQAEATKTIESRTRAGVEARALLALAREKMTVPVSGRRVGAQGILQEYALLRHQIPDGLIADELDLLARSAFADSLRWPDILPPESTSKLPGDEFRYWRVAIHPNGDFLAVGAPRGPLRWSRGQPYTYAPGAHDGTERPGVQFSPDGQHLAFLPEDGGLELWDGTVSRKLAEWKPDDARRILAVGFAPGGQSVSACDTTGTVQQFSLPGLTVGRRWSTPEMLEAPNAARFSADVAQLAIGSDYGDLAVFKLDGMGIQELSSPQVAITSLAWSPSGKILAVGMRDGAVQLWNVEEGMRMHQMQLGTGGINQLEFSPDGRYLAGGFRTTGSRLWDVVTGEQLIHLVAVPCGYSRDGRTLACGGIDGVHFCDLILPDTIREYGGHQSVVDRIAWSRNNRHFASLDNRFRVCVWDLLEHKLVDEFSAPPGGYWANEADIALSDDGRVLALVNGGDSQAILRDVVTHSTLGTWKLPRGFERLQCSGGSKFVLARVESSEMNGGTSSVLYEWSLDGGPRRARILRPAVDGEESFLNHQLTLDARHYAWVGPRQPGKDRRIEIREVSSGRLIKSIPVPKKDEDDGAGAFLSGDGRSLWMSNGDDFSLVDLEPRGANRKQRRMPSAVSPDGRWFLEGSSPDANHVVGADVLRRLVDGPAWLELSNRDRQPTNFGLRSFSPDGRHLAIGSETGPITIVDLQSLESLVTRFEATFRP